MKLKNKMTIAVSTLVVVLTAAVALFSLGYFERKLQETIAGQQLSIVSYIADEIDHVLLTSRDLLVASADIFPLEALASPERARAFLRTRTSLHRLFNNHLMLVGPDGFMIAESYPSPDGDKRLNLTDAPFFRETLQTGKPVISGLTTCCADLSPTQVIMTAPVRDPDGTIRAVLMGSFSLKRPNPLTRFSGIKIGRSGSMQIISSKRIVLVHPDPGEVLRQVSTPLDRLVGEAINGFSGTRRTVDGDGNPMLTTVGKLEVKDWVIAASYPEREAFAPIRTARNVFLVVILCGVLAAVALASGLSRYLTAPLTDFTRHIKELPRKQGRDRLVTIDTEDEIEELSAAFNAMVTDLDRLNAGLEGLVAERTARLEEANAALRQEVEQRTRAQEEICWLNDDLERQKTALMAANRELESFGFSVSHDLRAPLRHIEGFSTVLLEDCGDRLDDDGKGYLDRIVASCRRMDELITDLLNLSRLSQGEVRRERVDLSAMAAVVAEELRRGEPQRRVDIRIGPGLSAICDPSLVRIMLENLLGNAWKYTARKDQGVIEFGAAGEGGETVFFVRDNGAGFDMSQVERLFVPFQRLHPAGEFEGTGIGLATVRRIAVRHGGRVWAEGDPGTGATFFFTL
uniref:histidine kinase n=1 Tax=Geobacter metallireducens TaxID=28232 RepID=A0A831XFH0_GEOME